MIDFGALQVSSVGDLSPQDFRRLADVMRRESGVELLDTKISFVQSRILRRLRALNLNSYQAYCDIVEQGDGHNERLNMLSALTTNVTGFFRERHHFDYLKDHRIPDLTKRLRAGASVRVWSAGCSTGEEPYSLALTFLEASPDIGNYDFKILATDIDPLILKKAMIGNYRAAELKSVPPQLRNRYFRAEDGPGDLQAVSEDLRKLVTFRRLNLLDPWPLTRVFDIILCRNVVIYFAEETKVAIWEKMMRQLHPMGCLMTGHAERLNGPAAAEMELVTTTTYQLAKLPDAQQRKPKCP